MTTVSWLLGLGALTLYSAGCATAPKIRFPVTYIDMDGTLLTSKKTIRPASLEAIRRYQACGGLVGIATGRTVPQVDPYLGEVRPDLPVVLYNGAVTVKPDGRTVVAVSRLPAGARERIVTGAVHLTSVRGVVLHGVQETTVDRRSEGFDAFIERSRIGPTRVDPKLGALTEGEPVKVLLFVAEDGIEGVRDTLRESVAAARVLVTSNETVEVVASGVTKAKAIRAIVAERDIAPADVLTFGDSGNDVEMLSELGPGLAMANCRPEACGAALARIGSHDTDTIAAALRKLATTPACGGEGGREQSGPASVSEAERP